MMPSTLDQLNGLVGPEFKFIDILWKKKMEAKPADVSKCFYDLIILFLLNINLRKGKGRTFIGHQRKAIEFKTL